MSEDWPALNAEIKAGRLPWVRRVENSEICLWHIYADPDDPDADFDMILIGRPCPTLTRWRFDSTTDSEVPGGPYCWPHLRKIVDTPAEVGRWRRMVQFREWDEKNRQAWRGQ